MGSKPITNLKKISNCLTLDFRESLRRGRTRDLVASWDYDKRRTDNIRLSRVWDWKSPFQDGAGIKPGQGFSE